MWRNIPNITIIAATEKCSWRVLTGVLQAIVKMKSKLQLSKDGKVDVPETETLTPTSVPMLRRNQFVRSAQSTLLLLSPAVPLNGLVIYLRFHPTPLLCCFLLHISIALPCFQLVYTVSSRLCTSSCGRLPKLLSQQKK